MVASVFVGTSVDGFIARPNGALDFLPEGGGEPADIVAKLAATGARHLYIDGGISIQRFLRAGLIQRLIVTRVPVLIGTGIPLFGTLPHDVRLQHVATRPYASGLVQSEYRIGD
jgi:dihydrofolate reductase